MYFIDRKKIGQTLDYMEKLLVLFNDGKMQQDRLVEFLALERLAHVTIESIIDVGNTMIDGFIMRDPGSYEDIVDIMEDEQVISKEMAGPLKRIVGLRKMIVLDFIDVNIDLIARTLEESMPALLSFPINVRHYLENELGPVSAFLPEDQ